MYGRQRLAEGSHGAREYARQRRRGGETDPEVADLAARGALGGFDGAGRLRQRRACLDQEQLAGFGQFDLPPVAVEQRDAKLALDRLDLQAQGRLADVQAFRRAAEVQLLGDRDEITELAKFHSYLPERI